MTSPTRTELTQLEPGVVATPFRNVANPNQNASGSIHDQATATKLGFRGGTVAGSNHMDLFAPLAAKGCTVDLLKGHDDIPGWLDGRAAPGSLVLTLGAGDIGRQVENICRHLAARADGPRGKGRS